MGMGILRHHLAENLRLPHSSRVPERRCTTCHSPLPPLAPGSDNSPGELGSSQIKIAKFSTMMIYGDDVFLFLSHIYIYIYIYLWLNFLKIAKISEKWWKMEVSLFHQSFDICYGDLTIKHWRGCAWISQRKNIEKWNPYHINTDKVCSYFLGRC